MKKITLLISRSKYIFGWCMLVFLLATASSKAQDVTEIWTNYDGFWNSSSTSLNPVQPDNSHELLAFRWGTDVYSTGVDDALLTTNGVTIDQAMTVRALPVATLPNTNNPPNFIGLGQLFDGIDGGVDNGATNPFPANLSSAQVASFLTDGVQGLDLGTNVTNIPSGTTARFNLSSAGITVGNVGDGIPDLLVSQTAQPSPNTDELEFVDINGNTVGNIVSLDITNEPVVGNWIVDFYEYTSSQTQNNFINTPRPIHFFAVDLSDFGITTGSGGNIGDAVALLYRPNGNSDPSFIGFNEPSLGVATQLSVILQPSNQDCDGTISDIQIQLEDQNGLAVAQAGISITATLESGPGDLLGTLTQVTNGSGAATFDDLSFSVGGTHTIRFSYTSLDPAVTTLIDNGPATGGSCSSSCGTFTWNGSVSTDWDNASNWTLSGGASGVGNIPDANSDVVIPDLGPSANYPILAADAGAKDIEMQTNSSVTLNGNLFVINGEINISSGTPQVDASAAGSILYMSGCIAQTIPDGFLSDEVANFTVENTVGVTLEDSFDLTETFSLLEGTLDISTTDPTYITFKSNVSQTAVMTEAAAGTTINGCVIVERYIPESTRGFRLISAPTDASVVCGSETIKASLQEGGQITDYSTTPIVDPNPGFGTHITGATQAEHNLTDNGFDVTNTGNPGMFTWDASAQDWLEIPNTNNTDLNRGDSYALFVRGDRSLDLTVDNAQVGNATTLRFTGELVSGDVAVPGAELSSTIGDFNLIANPYQSQVDMRSLLQSPDASGLSPTFMYIYDPTIGTNGGYATVDLDANSSTPAVSEANRFLQPNQAVFIETTAASPSLTFKEAYKADVDVFLILDTFDEGPSETRFDLININLERIDNNQAIVMDGTRLSFSDTYDNEVTQKDAVKLWNETENLALVSGNQYLSVERQAIPAENSTKSLNTEGLLSHDYELELNLQNMSFPVQLRDNYLDTVVTLNNNTTTTYAFTVDTNIPESAAEDRFELVFSDETFSAESFEEDNLIVYPMPVSELVNIKLPALASGTIADLVIHDMTGRVILTKELTADVQTLRADLSELQTGIYHLSVEVNSKRYSKKIIVK